MAFNIILVIFQLKVIFQQLFFQHSYAQVWMKKFIKMFFVKSHEWNFSYGIEMVQSTHIQYMTKYFIKFCNYFSILKICLHFLAY